MASRLPPHCLPHISARGSRTTKEQDEKNRAAGSGVAMATNVPVPVPQGWSQLAASGGRALVANRESVHAVQGWLIEACSSLGSLEERRRWRRLRGRQQRRMCRSSVAAGSVAANNPASAHGSARDGGGLCRCRRQRPSGRGGPPLGVAVRCDRSALHISHGYEDWRRLYAH